MGLSLRLGKYDLLGRIGYGGMAEVWLARQHGPMGFEKLVAIKRLLPHLQDQDPFVRMFLDEARIAARINHANVAQIFDLGEAEEGYFIAMEYLLGESLARVMGESVKRNQPLPELLGAAVVSQMCKGLHHAHTLLDSRGQPLAIVHRDVSPQNVVLLYDGGVKLLDFGIAKARQRLAENTTTGVKGKYSYMSPEQCLGEPLDHRSDIFSVGIVLWELLARRRLYKNQNKLLALKMITDGHVGPPSLVNPALPPELDRIALRALARNPADRYQSAEELSVALDELLAQAGVTAPGAKLADYLSQVFGEDLQRRTEFTNAVSVDNPPVGETAEHWLDLLPEPTGEVISFSRSPAVATSTGAPAATEARPVPRASQIWWAATAVVALLAALVTLGVLLFSNAGSRLIVESMPAGARLLVDGEERAPRTPAAVERLRPGSHRVTLELRGHRRWERELELRGGETLRIEAALQARTRLAASPAARAPRTVDAGSRVAVAGTRDAGAPPGAEAAADRAGRSIKRTRSIEPAHGRLNLATSPWATIFLGRRKLGDTPLIAVTLPAGTHNLIAVNPEEKIRTTITVEIKKGQTLRKQVRLRP